VKSLGKLWVSIGGGTSWYGRNSIGLLITTVIGGFAVEGVSKVYVRTIWREYDIDMSGMGIGLQEWK
jgi:hypothetical protein